MNPAAKQLALATLTRIREQEGNANKTKLLKLLYLADIEHFRHTGAILTGFDWVFFLYGPWAAEFDELLKQLETEGAIRIEPWAAKTVEGERISSVETVQLENVIENTNEFFRVRRQIDTWTAEALPSLLDYVYFDTEPMQGAVKMQRLDFSKVSQETPALYKRTKSAVEPKDLRKVRELFSNLQKRVEEQIEKGASAFSAGPVDEEYISALAQLDQPEAD